MSPPEPDAVVLRCMRVADLPEPVEGSTVDHCARCAQAVWVGPGATEHFAAVHPGLPLAVVCTQCALELTDDADDVVHMVLPDDIERMRADGYDLAHTAAIFAAATVSDAASDLLVALMEEPDGRLAERFRETYRAAKVMLAGYERRN